MLFFHKLAVFTISLLTSVSSAHPGSASQFERINHLIEQNPQSQPLMIKRASLYIQKGDTKKARQDLGHAASLGDPIETAFEMGKLQSRNDEFKQAIASFERYLKRYPGHALSFVYSAKAAWAIGELDLAMDNFNAYFRHASNPHPGEYLAAAGVLLEKWPQDFAPALQLLDGAMQRLGSVPQLQRYATELELKRRNYSGAIERWRSVETALSSSPQWKLDAARIYIMAGEPTQALELLNQVKVQLQGLKPTPARIENALKLRELELVINPTL